MSTILIVEDDGPTRLALTEVMQGEGFEVLNAADGDEGLRTALEKHPDIILADLKMPKMGGLEMIHEIRADEWGKDAEIIILTNVSDVEMLQKAMQENTFYYIVKSDTGVTEVVEKVKARLAAKKV